MSLTEDVYPCLERRKTPLPLTLAHPSNHL